MMKMRRIFLLFCCGNMCNRFTMILRLLLFSMIIFVSNANSQILYECNFDNATLVDNCFTTTTMLVQSSSGTLSSQPPESPFSDVTSILKPTSNSQVCSLPYKVASYQWDMYFCYNGRCSTLNSPNSSCESGKFGFLRLTSGGLRSFQLKTSPSGINGIDKQCLIYYYYMSIGGQKSITIRKVEIDDTNEVIDVVRNSSFNGWIRQEVTFVVKASGYKLYFDAEKISTEAYAPYVGFDEISVNQGSCDKEITTSVSVDFTSAPTSVLQTTQMAITTVKVTSPNQSSFTNTTTRESSRTSINTTIPYNLTSASTSISSVPNSTTTIGKMPGVTTPNETYIIILATAVSVVSITIIGIVIWMKMSSSPGFFKSISRPFTNLNRHNELSSDLELDLIEDDNAF